jgi:hypothetical protein
MHTIVQSTKVLLYFMQTLLIDNRYLNFTISKYQYGFFVTMNIYEG